MRKDNYEQSRDRAQAYFLRFDQQRLIRRWDLKHDRERLYVDFLGKLYGICRQSGVVTRLWDGRQAGYEEALSIFDLLCHEGEHKYLSGSLAPVNSLKGRPPTAGVDTDFYGKAAAAFDKAPELFCKACLAMGGQPVNMGDLGFRFPVFGAMPVILKFYRSDEEFPASLTLLWDENALQYMFYETVFYVAGVLLEELVAQMGN